MRISSILLLLGECTVPAAAQPATARIPGLGVAWDGRSGQIRPIHGIPGAAILGEGTRNTRFTAVAISPRHDLALGVSAGEGKLQAVNLPSETVQDVPGVSPAPSRLIFSPSGTAALAVGTRLQVLTGLSGSPEVQDLATPPESGTPTAIAVSDDAQLVLFSAGSGDTASTWLLAPGYAPVQLALSGPIAVAAFRPGSRDAAGLAPNGSIYRILNTGVPAEVRQVYNGEERTADPVALRLSADGSRAYSANRLGTIAVIDFASASIETIDCGCVPTGIEPLTTSNLYRINEISDRPVMLFDVSTPAPRVWFVPSDAPSSDSKWSGQ